MASISLSTCSALRLSIGFPNTHQSSLYLCRSTPRIHPLHAPTRLGSVGYDPLRVFVRNEGGKGGGAVCYSSLNPRDLHWVSTVANVILMLTKGTAMRKSFLVPLFALQAPGSVANWMKGEYGIWIAFLALLVRLFFFIPEKLELPFMGMLLVILWPYQLTRLRGTKEGAVVSLAIAAYLAFQHFSTVGSIERAFEQGSVLATIGTTCIVAVPCLLLMLLA